MRLTEELFIWVPIFVLGAYQWVCLRRKIIQNQWISIYSINLAKEWHKLNKAQVVHLRSQARHDVLRVLQKEGVSSFSLQPFDDLGHELTSMEDTMEERVQPAWTPWLCFLVMIEMLQYLAIPFASKIHWDRESTWKLVPEIFSHFLPNPAEHRVYDLTTWMVLAPLYGIAFCILWLLLFGACLKWIPFIQSEETHDDLSDIFMKMLLLGRRVFISTKEFLFDFASLFILTGIIRSLYDQNGNLDSYYPSSVLVLFFFFALLLWSNEGTNSVRWLHRMVHFFIASEAQLYGKLPENDAFYYNQNIATFNNQDLQKLCLYVVNHQRPAFASRWIFFSSFSKLIMAALFVLAHFEDFWGWVLLSVSTLLIIGLIHQSVKHGPCNFQWINVFRNIALIAVLWGNLCGFFAQALHSYPDLTYSFTPTATFVAGLGVILGSFPFCVFMSRRLFTCSPLRVHPLKLQILHMYYKFATLGRIASIQRAIPNGGSNWLTTELQTLLTHHKFEQIVTTEQNASTKKLLLNHELWVTWIKKNAQFVKLGHSELSMQDKINVCSKKKLARCMPVSEDCSELQIIQKIKDWMREAEMVIDPRRDIELGLRVPDDEYLSFDDGAPIFTGDPGRRVFSEKSLHHINLVPKPRRERGGIFRSQAEIETAAISDQSPAGSISLNAGGGGTVFRSWGSGFSFQQPFPQDQGERPNRVGSMRESLSSLVTNSTKDKSQTIRR